MNLLFGMTVPPDTYIFSRFPDGDIYLVEDLTLARKLFNEIGLSPHLGNYSSLEEYIENCIELDLTHEVIHVILFHLEGFATTDAFDKADYKNEITGFPRGL